MPKYGIWYTAPSADDYMKSGWLLDWWYGGNDVRFPRWFDSEQDAQSWIDLLSVYSAELQSRYTPHLYDAKHEPVAAAKPPVSLLGFPVAKDKSYLAGQFSLVSGDLSTYSGSVDAVLVSLPPGYAPVEGELWHMAIMGVWMEFIVEMVSEGGGGAVRLRYVRNLD